MQIEYTKEELENYRKHVARIKRHFWYVTANCPYKILKFIRQRRAALREADRLLNVGDFMENRLTDF